MAYIDLRNKINGYDRGGGLEILRTVLADAECDLALALEIFYSAGGYKYLEALAKPTRLQKFNPFITGLYSDILNNRFPKTDRCFKNPLSMMQKERLRKMGIAEILLADL